MSEEDRHGRGRLSPVPMCNFSVPNDIIPKILTYLDNNSINNCRLVCQQWNEAIVNSAKLMRRLTFKVWDFDQFDSSYILPNIRSLSIQNPLPGGRENVQQFFTAIGNTVEHIDIHLPNSINKDSAIWTLSALFSSCSRLQDLNLVSCIPTEKILCELSPEILQTAGSSIKRLELTFDLNAEYYWYSPFSPAIKTLILSLPSLSSITLLGSSVSLSDPQVVNILSEHMEQFVGTLKVIRSPSQKLHMCLSTFAQLLSTATRLGVHFEVNDHCHWEGLDELLEADSLKALDNEALTEALQPISDAQFDLECLSTGQGIRKLGLCTELSKLCIDFARYPTVDELNALQNLSKLTCLKLNVRFAMENVEDNLVQQTIDIPQIELASLQSLCLEYELFNPTAYASFHSVFPNLVKLSLNRVRPLPDDFFRSLAKLNRLNKLRLSRLPVTNEMMVEQVQIFGTNGDVTRTVSAIASLAQLKCLLVEFCLSLTDVAIRDGIAMCGQLDHVELSYRDGQFSADCLSALLEARSLEIDKSRWNYCTFAASKRTGDLRVSKWAWNWKA